MKRLTLAIDDLQVESFTTAPPADKRGTVFGNQITAGGSTCLSTCFQKICGCTYGDDGDNGTCNFSCNVNTNCGTECPTGATYPGCD